MDPAKYLRPALLKKNRDSRRFQLDRRKSTGFAGPDAAFAHELMWVLQTQFSYSHSRACYAAHLVASATLYNFQGNVRIAGWMQCNARTCRRARVQLERDGLIRSELLMPGDKVPGMSAPVSRVQVVRDVSALRALVNIKPHQRTKSVRSKGGGSRRGAHNPSQTRAPSTASTPATADDLQQLASRGGEFSSFFATMAAAKRGTGLPKQSHIDEILHPAPSQNEIDAWEAETEQLEREQREGDTEPSPPPDE